MAYQRTTERIERTEHAAPVATEHHAEAEEVHAVAADPYDARRDSAWRVGQLVYLVFGVAIALIAIRFVLLLLGANPDAGFTNLVYSVTNPLVAPFEGIFGAPNLETGVFDPASLVAMAIYALVGWAVGKLLDILLSDTRTGVHTSARRIDTELH